MTSKAKVAKARQRRRRAGLGSALGTLLVASVLYLSIAVETALLRHEYRSSLLAQADLGITPAEGIGIVAALVAVVVSINLTLAVLTVPDDPVERVMSADWQIAMAIVALLCGGISVLTVLMCWFSGQRSHSWGALIGATALSSITVVLASLIWIRARSEEYAKAEMYRLRRRRRRLLRAAEQFADRHPYRPRSLPVVALGCLAAVAFTSLVSALITHGVLVATHHSDPAKVIFELAVLTGLFQAPLLLSGCRCWLLPYAEGVLDRISDAGWFVLILALELFAAINISIKATPTLRPATVTYTSCLLVVPLALLIADRRIRPVALTFGLRAFACRPLPARLREVQRELEASRKLRRRIRAETRPGELQGVR